MLNPHQFDLKTKQIIGIAMEVHKTLGFGFLEPVYQKAMEIELSDKKIFYKAQSPINVRYKNRDVGYYVPDLIVGNIIVELKAQETVNLDQIQAQVINYLVATKLPVGLYINFGKPRLEFKRFIIPSKFQSDFNNGF